MEQLKLIIKNTQIYESHTDSQEQEVEASIGDGRECKYIIFDQLHEGTDVKTHNIIKVKKAEIEVKRTGAISNKLVFNQDKPFITYYETELGSLDIKIITQAITCDLTTDHMHLEIKYELIMQGKKASDNVYSIKIKK